MESSVSVRSPSPVAARISGQNWWSHTASHHVELLASFCGQDGQVGGIVRPRHGSRELSELLDLLGQQTPVGRTIHLVLDTVSLHRSKEVAAWQAARPDRVFQFPFLPVHSAWLSVIEVWFSILTRQCLTWASFSAAADDAQITAFIATYHRHSARPFTWETGVRLYRRLQDKLAEQRSALTRAA